MNFLLRVTLALRPWDSLLKKTANLLEGHSNGPVTLNLSVSGHHRRFQNLADMVAPFLSCRLSVYRSPTAKQYYRGALSTHSRDYSSDAGLLYHYNRPSVAIPNIRRIVTIAGNKGRTNTASLACQYHSWVS